MPTAAEAMPKNGTKGKPSKNGAKGKRRAAKPELAEHRRRLYDRLDLRDRFFRLVAVYDEADSLVSSENAIHLSDAMYDEVVSAAFAYARAEHAYLMGLAGSSYATATHAAKAARGSQGKEGTR